MGHDVFFSYRHVDRPAAQPVVEALESLGLDVFQDICVVEDSQAIATVIRDHLADSKALVAWYSTNYPRSRPCQWKPTAAVPATCGEVNRRILVINPDKTAEHIHPIALRASLFLPPTGLPGGLAGLLARYDTPLSIGGCGRTCDDFVGALVDRHGHWNSTTETLLPRSVSVQRLPKLVRKTDRAEDEGYVVGWMERLTTLLFPT